MARSKFLGAHHHYLPQCFTITITVISRALGPNHNNIPHLISIKIVFFYHIAQKNKATNYHLGTLKAKLAKLRNELLIEQGGGGSGGRELIYIHAKQEVHDDCYRICC